MLKVWLLNLLLSRGVSALQEYLGKTLRNTIIAGGTALAASGHPLSEPDQTTLIGAGMIVLGVGLDYARTWLANYAAKKGTNQVGVVQTAHAPPAP